MRLEALPHARLASKPASRLAGTEGMTLVELVVGMVIAALVIAAAAGILLASSRLAGDAAARQERITLAETVLAFVAEDVRGASEAQMLPAASTPTASTSEPGCVYDFIADKNGSPAVKGMLWTLRGDIAARPAYNAYGEDFYSGNSVALAFTVVNAAPGAAKAVTVEVSVYDAEGNMSVSRSKTLQLLNSPEGVPPLPEESGTTLPSPDGAQPYVLMLRPA
jgi:type II secretory pathway pseudopilin PulG